MLQIQAFSYGVKCWEEDADYYGYENSLGVHIRHLREKLETEPGAPRFLRTARGIGYKLTKEGEP